MLGDISNGFGGIPFKTQRHGMKFESTQMAREVKKPSNPPHSVFGFESYEVGKN